MTEVLSPAEPRALRADAARNRRQLLDAATEAFAEVGLDVSIAEIAQRAGVGKGTVFRHFETKEHLVAEVLTEHVGRLVESVGAVAPTLDPLEAVRFFLTANVEMLVGDRSFFDAACGAAAGFPQVLEMGRRQLALAESLLDRAQQAGVVRDDLTGTDLLLLPGAVSQMTRPMKDVRPDLWRRYLNLVIDALSPQVAGSLATPAATMDELISTAPPVA